MSLILSVPCSVDFELNVFHNKKKTRAKIKAESDDFRIHIFTLRIVIVNLLKLFFLFIHISWILFHTQCFLAIMKLHISSFRSAVFGRTHGSGCTREDSSQVSDGDDVDLDRMVFQADSSRVHNELDMAVLAGSCGC